MKNEIMHKLGLRHLRLEDYEAVRNISNKVYKGVSEPWTKEEMSNLISRFGEGQVCIEDNGRPVAIALSVIVDFTLLGKNHTYDKVTGNGSFKNHDPEGDYLYGIEVIVDPDYRGIDRKSVV